MEMKLLCLLAFVWSQIHGFPFFLVDNMDMDPSSLVYDKKGREGIKEKSISC